MELESFKEVDVRPGNRVLLAFISLLLFKLTVAT